MKCAERSAPSIDVQDAVGKRAGKCVSYEVGLKKVQACTMQVDDIHVFFKISRSGITFYQTSYLLMIFQMSAFVKISTWCCEELNSDMSTVI